MSVFLVFTRVPSKMNASCTEAKTSSLVLEIGFRVSVKRRARDEIKRKCVQDSVVSTTNNKLLNSILSRG